MKLFKADHDRRVEIPGVPGPVRRPVSLDPSTTGFTRLRSLRIYQFDAGTIIKGHAEEDEVFVVVLSGSIELRIGWENSEISAGVFMLSAPERGSAEAFVAYLPAHSTYELTPRTQADVAYARALPLHSRQPAVFQPAATVTDAEISTLLDQRTHASQLRLRVLQVDATRAAVTLNPLHEADAMGEAFVHVRSLTEERVAVISNRDRATLTLDAWDTVATAPGDCPLLEVAEGTQLLLMTVAI